MVDRDAQTEQGLRFACPECEAEIANATDRDTDWISCTQCGAAVNLAAQFAINRADDNYRFAQALAAPELIDPHKRPNAFSPDAKDALRAYQKAYTGIQVALRADLPPAQQARALEIMSETAYILQRNQMISPLEAKYWTQVMVCQTALEEFEALEAKLHREAPGLLTRIFRHPHWRLRRFQLKRALARRQARLEELESNLAFVETHHIRW
jgi:hypothetical protein